MKTNNIYPHMFCFGLIRIFLAYGQFVPGIVLLYLKGKRTCIFKKKSKLQGFSYPKWRFHFLLKFLKKLLLNLILPIQLIGMMLLHPFMPNRISHPYQMDEFISYLRGIGVSFKCYILQANSAKPHQTLHFAAADLVLHCLVMSHKMDARLIIYGLTSTMSIKKLFPCSGLHMVRGSI